MKRGKELEKNDNNKDSMSCRERRREIAALFDEFHSYKCEYCCYKSQRRRGGGSFVVNSV